MLGLTDDIRRFVFERYIRPAIDQGRDSITIRAGDVHSMMGLYSRMPAVCSALGGRKSIDLFNQWLRESGYNYRVVLVSVRTPPSGQGANSYYTYKFVKNGEKKQIKPVISQQSPLELLTRDLTSRVKSEDITEEVAREIMSSYLGIPLYKQRLDIYGKFKEFDLVNIEHRVVGDFKRFKYKGPAMAEMSNLVEYIWLMEKLEKYTNTQWRKIIVGAGNRKTFETFARRYNPWLKDLEIYFITPEQRIIKIR